MNAVNRLFNYRKSLSTTTYKSRGQRVIRCELCQLAKQFCICEFAPLQHSLLKNKLSSNAGVLLLMYDTEVLKPSNTGKLIADLIPDTYAFLWSRTVPNLELQAVLDDEQWQPFVVFPKEYALIKNCSVHSCSTDPYLIDNVPEREVITDKVICKKGKRPLFILLDGSWREAKKMFRKSPYLDKFPVVSFDPKNVLFQQVECKKTESNVLSKENSLDVKESVLPRYHIRKTDLSYQFSTAEVTARVLAMSGESVNSRLLDLWFDVFSFQYQRSVCQSNQGDPKALNNYQMYINQIDK